jgi:putative transcriptional regulator
MSAPYHYDICGLSNVYLTGGVTQHETPYGTGVSITAADALHTVLAQSLMGLERDLSGEEHRFLRTILDLAPDDELFRSYGLGERAVRNHEDARAVPVPAAMDVAIRAIAAKLRADLVGPRCRQQPIGARIAVAHTPAGWVLQDAA